MTVDVSDTVQGLLNDYGAAVLDHARLAPGSAQFVVDASLGVMNQAQAEAMAPFVALARVAEEVIAYESAAHYAREGHLDRMIDQARAALALLNDKEVV